ncbi:MAG: hypothetical protein AB1509_14350 [Chloroflexota bacterium]
MNAQQDRKTAFLATVSLILGILSFGLVLVAMGILIRVRLPGGPTDDAPLLALGFLAVFLMLGGLVLGIPGWLIAAVARHRNNTEGNDQKTRKTAAAGLILNGSGVAAVVLLFGIAWLFGPNTAPPIPLTPVPSTASP